MEFNNSPVIFVVEDNLIYQLLIAKQLESLNGTLHFYTTGEACLRDLDRNPCLIILDYNLDGQLSGLDTLKQLRQHLPEVHAIVFSNQADVHTHENLLHYGAFDFLEKCDHSFKTLQQMVLRFLKIPSLA